MLAGSFLFAVALFTQTVVDVPSGAANGPAHIEVEQDPITDTVSTFAVAQAENGRLSIGCDPDRFEGIRIALQGRGWFGGENQFTDRLWVKYRFDGAPPQRSRWGTERGSAYLGRQEEVQTFLAWISAADRISIRAKDVENRETDFIFALDDARPAVSRMIEACGAQAGSAAAAAILP